MISQNLLYFRGWMDIDAFFGQSGNKLTLVQLSMFVSHELLLTHWSKYENKRFFDVVVLFNVCLADLHVCLVLLGVQNLILWTNIFGLDWEEIIIFTQFTCKTT